MTYLIILLAVAAAIAIVWTARHFSHLITEDGYGHRPPPRSHHDDELRDRLGSWA